MRRSQEELNEKRRGEKRKRRTICCLFVRLSACLSANLRFLLWSVSSTVMMMIKRRGRRKRRKDKSGKRRKTTIKKKQHMEKERSLNNSKT